MLSIPTVGRACSKHLAAPRFQLKDVMMTVAANGILGVHKSVFYSPPPRPSFSRGDIAKALA